MDTILALLLRLMRKARLVFIALYVVVSVGFLYADPRAGWTWFIVVAGAGMCLLFWGLVAFWTRILARDPGDEGDSGSRHG